MTKHDKVLIQTAWNERGRFEWDPEVHGRQLASLNIAADAGMKPSVPGAPIPLHDNLEFRLVQTVVNGETINAIVCEGVIVEPIIQDFKPPPQPVRFKSTMAQARKRRRG